MQDQGTYKTKAQNYVTLGDGSFVATGAAVNMKMMVMKENKQERFYT